MRIGVFGGSFDPVHLGHLLLAECCQQQAQLERVIFVPAAHQPHKPLAPRASDADRVAMLRLAIPEISGWEVSTVEIDRGGISYTVDTLRELKAREPEAELFFLMGADALADLPNWRDPAVICELALPLVVRRSGAPEPDFGALEAIASPSRIAEIRRRQVEMRPTLISSSGIRRLIHDGAAWRELVPQGVADYIVARGMYGV